MLTIDLCQLIEMEKLKAKPLSPKQVLCNRRFIIYGGGEGGRILCANLMTEGLYAECFLDRAATENEYECGIPKYTPDYNGFTLSDKDSLVVLIAVWDSSQHEKIFNMLRGYGYKNIITMFDIAYYYTAADNSIVGLLDIDFYSRNLNDILSAEELFLENLSREIYQRHVKAYIENDYRQFYPRMPGDQYFPNDIHFSRGYERFIDCGAYTGDTIQMLYENKGRVKAIAAFEPSERNFIHLSNIIEWDKVSEVSSLYPCGVWSESRQRKFGNQIETGTNMISDNGEINIQCVKLDDALHGFNPTFIKMDIEGAELDALKGAARIIKESSPDLAIAIYHNVNHIWDIPILLKEIEPKYQFYLRSHGHNGIETILYATVKE